MQLSALPVLQHPDVTLRSIEAADLDHWAAYLKDPVVYEHTSWNINSVTELEAYVWAAQSHTPDSRLRLAIACRQTNQLVGTIGFHSVSGVNRSAELAYDLAPSHWNKGIATT